MTTDYSRTGGIAQVADTVAELAGEFGKVLLGNGFICQTRTSDRCSRAAASQRSGELNSVVYIRTDTAY